MKLFGFTRGRRSAPTLLALLTTLTLACDQPPADPSPGVIHLIPHFAANRSTFPVVRDEPDRELLMDPSAWSVAGGTVESVREGLVVSADPTEEIVILTSPPALGIPVETLDSFLITLAVSGARRFELWCELRDGSQVADHIAEGDDSGIRFASSRVATGSTTYRVRASQALEETSGFVDRIYVVLRWTDGDRRVEFSALRSKAISGMSPRGRLRLGGINLQAWSMRGGARDSARLTVPPGARMMFSVAARGESGHEAFEVVIRDGDLEETVYRRNNEFGEGKWVPETVDLAAFAGRSVELEFRAIGSPRSSFAWGAPVVVGTRKERRDVLVWVIDTLRADLLGGHGFPGRTSSSIDRLARTGTTFRECYSTTSWTRPAMASLMTSRAPLTHGAHLASRSIRQDLPTFAERMSEGGWYTIGLISNPNAGRPAGLDRGYDVVVELQTLFRSFIDGMSPEEQKILGAVSSSSPSGTSEWIHSWLEKRWPELAGIPVFVYAHANDPHRPNEPRIPFSEVPHPDKPIPQRPRLLTWYREYAGDVVAADHFFGRTTRLLERLGLSDRTIVVLMADHGEEFREHGSMGHGTSLYPEQIRIPLTLRAPGLIPANHVAGRRASLLDVQPTILELVSLRADPDHEGRSLVAELTDPTLWEEDPGPTFLHLVHQARRLDDNVANDSTLVGELAVIEDGWKYMLEDYGEHGDSTIAHLYDLTNDPDERTDLVDEYPELARELATKALAWWAQSRRGVVSADGPVEIDAETEEVLRALGYLD